MHELLGVGHDARRTPRRWPDARGRRRAAAGPIASAASTTGMETPASAGLPGPGEMSTASYSRDACGDVGSIDGVVAHDLGRRARAPAGSRSACRRSCRSCRGRGCGSWSHRCLDRVDDAGQQGGNGRVGRSDQSIRPDGRLGCVLPLGQDGLGWESQSDSDRIARMARTKPSKPARAEQTSGEEAPNPVWFKPIMFGFMLVGLVWIIVFYVSQGRLPDRRPRLVEHPHRLRHRLRRLPHDDALALALRHARHPPVVTHRLPPPNSVSPNWRQLHCV